MTSRTHGDSLPAFLLRFLMAPAAIGALLATATALLRRHAQKPSVSRMSEDWLRNHDIGRRRDRPW